MLKHVWAALTAVLIATPAPGDEYTVKTSDDPVLRAMMDVTAVYNLDDEKNHVTLRLFIRSAGNPAMNGNQLLLAVIPAPEHAARIWKTGIAVDTVRSIVQDTGKSELRINTVERFHDDQRAVKERYSLYTIRYEVNPETGSVADAIQVRSEVTQ